MKLPLEIENRLNEISQQVESLGAELVEVAYRRSGGGALIALIVDKAGGITLEECAQINRQMSDYFDSFEGSPDSYILEVSSPGLDRPLKTERDFTRAVGQTVKAVYRGTDGRISECKGRIQQVEGGAVNLAHPSDGRVFQIPMAAIIRVVREIRV